MQINLWSPVVFTKLFLYAIFGRVKLGVPHPYHLVNYWQYVLSLYIFEAFGLFHNLNTPNTKIVILEISIKYSSKIIELDKFIIILTVRLC